MDRNRGWSRVVLLLLVAGFVFRRLGLLAVVGMMVAVFGVAWIWNRWALKDVIYRRRLQYRRAFPGEGVDCAIEVENRKFLPLGWLLTNDKWPLAVAPKDEELLKSSAISEDGILRSVLALRWYHRIRRSIPLVFRERGVYTLGPATAISGDPFGVFETRAELARWQRVVVFPEVRPTSELGLKPDDPFGPRKTTRRLFEDASRPMGVRDYRPEDGFRRIHWPATARIGKLQTRVFQPISGIDLVVCLNIATLEPHWLGIRPKLLEELISTAASLIQEAFSAGYRVGMISNGGIAYAGRSFRVPPGRSPKQLSTLLEALAGITPVVIGPFSRFLIAQAPKLEYGSILLVVTAILTDDLLEAVMRLKERARKMIFFSLSEKEPPPISGVEIVHQPYRNRAEADRVP
jgi:uncharacterized protein (DUF58 family)